MTSAGLMWTVLFGAFGFAFFVYGRKQKAPLPLVCGIALMVYPYFVSNTYLIVAIGGALVALPFLIAI